MVLDVDVVVDMVRDIVKDMEQAGCVQGIVIRSDFTGDCSLSDIPRFLENYETVKSLSERIEEHIGRKLSEKDGIFLLKLQEIYGLSGDKIVELYRFCEELGKSSYAYMEAVAKGWRDGKKNEMPKQSPKEKNKKKPDYSAMVEELIYLQERG